MADRFDFARLDELIGRRVQVLRSEKEGILRGQITDVTTAIPVKLRQMLMGEGRDAKELKGEYGRRIHLNVKLDSGTELLVTWEEVEFLD